MPYAGLTPDVMLNAVDSVGYRTDGRLLALNSYENRVYQIGIEDEKPVVAKFYRPARWSNEQILEEHAFTLELAAREIPAVPPLAVAGRTLHAVRGIPVRGVSRAAAAGRRNWTIRRRWNGWGVSSAASMQWARSRHSCTGPRSTSRRFGEEPREYLVGEEIVPADLRGCLHQRDRPGARRRA